MRMQYHLNHSRKIEIIAHRGASWDAPENTLTAVRLGWERHADSVEVDIQIAADRNIMVIHDPTTVRTTGKNLSVRSTHSAELRTLDAGALKAPEYAGQRIPFLGEVLAEMPENKRIFIEIKCGPEILPYLCEALDRVDIASRTVIKSFDPDTAAAAKRALPHIPALWLTPSPRRLLTRRPLPHPPERIALARRNNLDGLSAQYTGITAEFAEQARSEGLQLYAWTVNDPAEVKRLVGLGIDGIVTDRPGLIREHLDTMKSEYTDSEVPDSIPR